MKIPKLSTQNEKRSTTKKNDEKGKMRSTELQQREELG